MVEKEFRVRKGLIVDGTKQSSILDGVLSLGTIGNVSGSSTSILAINSLGHVHVNLDTNDNDTATNATFKITEGGSASGIFTVLSDGKVELTNDMTIPQGDKIIFDSADTYITTDNSTDENLQIAADGNIDLMPDEDIVVKAGTTEWARFDGSQKALTIGSNLTTMIDSTVADEARIHVITANSGGDDSNIGYDMIIERQMGDADSPNQGPILALMSSNTADSGAGNSHMLDDTNIGALLFRGETDTGGDVNWGIIRTQIQDSANSSKDSRMYFKVQKANTFTELLVIDGEADTIDVAATNLSVAQNIIHTGDTNNKIQFGTDTQYFETGGSARLTITDAASTFSNTLTTTDLSVADEILHTGDTNNKIAFGTDTQSFVTGNATRMNISDTGLQIGSSGARVTTILDEDNMASDSATSLATQQSIKAYVDSNAGGGGATTLNGLTDVLVSNDSIFLNNFGSAPNTGTLSGGQQDNVAIGHNALDALTSGEYHVAIGSGAGGSVTADDSSVFIGKNAGLNSTPTAAVIIGKEAGESATTVDNSIMFGNAAGMSSTGKHTVFAGWKAGKFAGADYGIGIGRRALEGSSTVGNNTGTDNIAIGNEAMVSITSGLENVAVGKNAGANITSGSENVAVGLDAGANITTGDYNTAIGANAMEQAKATSDGNVAIGRSAGFYMGVNGNTIGIGQFAARGSTTVDNNTGYENIGIGYKTLYNHTSANYNVAIGHEAGLSIVGGDNNVGIGHEALHDLTSGVGNVGIGNAPIDLLTTGDYNVGIGWAAMGASDTGVDYNIALGYQAGRYFGSNHNIALGYHALHGSTTAANNTGLRNIAIGYEAAKGYTTGQDNVAIGFQAMESITTGSTNVAIGDRTLDALTTGSNNIAIGPSAGSSTSTDMAQGIFLGLQAGYYMDGDYNIGIGSQAVEGSSTTGNNTGNHNVGIGYQPMEDVTSGYKNVAIGYYAGRDITTGRGNVAIGEDAGMSITTGDFNIVIGKDAGDALEGGDDNIFIGRDAGQNATSGSDNVVICSGVGNLRDATGTKQLLLKSGSDTWLEGFGGDMYFGQNTNYYVPNSGDNASGGNLKLGGGAGTGSGAGGNLILQYAPGDAGAAATVNDYSDALTVDGATGNVTIHQNLTVSGTQTILNTATMTVEDKNIVLGSGNSGSEVVDATGLTLEGGTGDDVTFQYNATDDRMELKHGSAFEDFKAGTITGTFSGNITGNVTGNVSGSSGSTTGNAATATTATNVTVSANNSANETVYPVFVDGATGSQGAETDTGFTYNPSSGLLTAAAFSGALTGDVTGNVTGSSGSTTGNAATATLASTVTVSDSASNTLYPIVFHDESNGLLDDTGGLEYNPSTGLLTVPTRLGVGTSAVPHGSVGYAKLALEGTNQNAAGPHIQATTASDNYPLLQMLNWKHDNISINFDSYYDGGWKSSDAGSNYQIYKTGDILKFTYDSGIAAGSAVSWNIGMQLDTSGNVTIPNGTLTIGGGTLTLDGTNNRITGLTDVEPTAASGTDVAGTDLVLSGGKSTGDLGGGDIIFKTASLGSAGNSVNSLTERMRIHDTGDTEVKGNLTGRIAHGTGSNLYRFGGLYFTWDADNYGTNLNHSITSTDNGSFSDSLTINSYDKIRLNMDTNNNNTDSYIQFGRHSTGTGGDVFMTLDDGGDLGIGTTSPDEKLHVVGNAVVASTGSPTLSVKTTAANSQQANIVIHGARNAENTVGQITFSNADDAGTDTGTYNAANILAYNDGGNLAGGLKFQTTPAGSSTTLATAMTIRESGRVGIGTTSPDALLHVSSGTDLDCGIIIEADTDNNDEADLPFLWLKQDGDITAHALQATSNKLQIINNISSSGGIDFLTGTTNNTGTTNPATSASVRLHIASGGNVGIGTTSPVGLLDVQGTADGSGGYKKHLLIQDTGTAFDAANNGGALLFGGLQDASNHAYWAKISGEKANTTEDDRSGTLHFWTRKEGGNPTQRMIIDEDGNVGIGTTAPSTNLHVAQPGDTSTHYTALTLDNGIDTDGGRSVGMDLRVRYGSSNIASSYIGFDYYGDKLTSNSHGMIYRSGRAGFAHHHFVADDNTRQMMIADNGNVGIGPTFTHAVQPRSLLDVRGAAGSPGHLSLSTAETTVVDGDILGRIDFIAPVEADGTDSIALAASIYAEADDTFAADNNKTDIVFATGSSEAATEKMRLLSTGQIELSGTTVGAPADTNHVRLGFESEVLRIDSNEGYVQVGCQNTTYCHFVTNRGKFYFNRELVVNEGIISSYDENLILRRTNTDTDEQITIADNSQTFTTGGSDVMGLTSSQVTIDGSLTLKERASAPADNAGYGQLWVKSDGDGELYFTDDDGTDIQLTDDGAAAGGGGGGVSLSGSTDNTIATVTGSNAIQGEANLTFDGSTLALAGKQTITVADTVSEALKVTITDSDSTDDSTPFVVDGNGRVGIGTASPLTDMALTLNGDGTSYEGIAWQVGGSTKWKMSSDSSSMYVDSQANGIDYRFRIRDSAGALRTLLTLDGGVGGGTNNAPGVIIGNDGGTDSSAGTCMNKLQVNVGTTAGVQDFNDGILIVNNDAEIEQNDVIGGIGFDTRDGNVPSRTTEASVALVAKAREDHGTGDKGGYLDFYYTPTDGDDDNTSRVGARLMQGKLALGGQARNVADPINTLVLYHDASDWHNGMLILRDDTSISDGDLLGAIGFDGKDGNNPSNILEASAGIAAYAAEDHSTGDKGGDLTFFTSAINDDDDTTSHERMRIDSEGNVGIGTTSPGEKLHVAGAGDQVIKVDSTSDGRASVVVEGYKTSDATFAQIAAINNADSVAGVLFLRESADDAAAITFNTQESGSTSVAERVRVTSKGHLVVGATSVTGTTSHGIIEVANATQANFRATDTNGSSTDFAHQGEHTYIMNRSASGKIYIKPGNGDDSIELASNGQVKFNNEYTFPTSDGSANQVLQTNGSGALSFATVSGGSSTDSFLIFGEESDDYLSSTSGAGNANGWSFSYGNGAQNTTKSSSGVDFGMPVGCDCTLKAVYVHCGNKHSSTGSSNLVFDVYKNESAESDTFSGNASGSSGNAFIISKTNYDIDFSAGDRFNLRVTAPAGYNTSTKIGPSRMVAYFERQ